MLRDGDGKSSSPGLLNSNTTRAGQAAWRGMLIPRRRAEPSNPALGHCRRVWAIAGEEEGRELFIRTCEENTTIACHDVVI
jgi:hypothetical protein